VSFSKLQVTIAAGVVVGCLAATWIYTRRQKKKRKQQLKQEQIVGDL